MGELIKKELKNKTKYAFIYGSFARGTETQSSDIDLFFVSEIKEDELLKILQKIEKTTKREINYALWNEKTFNQRCKGHHLLKTIKKSKIIMLIGNENEFKHWIKESPFDDSKFNDEQKLAFLFVFNAVSGKIPDVFIGIQTKRKIQTLGSC